ncbi:MAG: ATP-dependent DNA helicase RecG [Caldilineaceae bacterium]|nr:ATP-dependent DNA helicase RecG [Caldilineaceae bacterium]
MRVLDLEERQGWRNRAVIGGLQAMAARWQKDAAQEEADPRIVATIVVLMERYQSGTLEIRLVCAESMRKALSGEIVDIGVDQAGDEDESPAYGDAATPEYADEADVEPVATTHRKKVDKQSNGAKPAAGERLDQSVERSGEDELLTLPTPEPATVARERVRRQQAASRRTADDLAAAVTILPGVGASTAELLGRLGIARMIDLIWHLPSRHDDFSQLRTIAQMRPGEQVTVIANVWEVRDRKISMKRQIVEAVLSDGTGTLRANWWNKYIRNQLKPGMTLRFSGKVGLFMGHKTLDNPVFEDVDEEMVATGRLTPVYPLTEGVSNKKLRMLIKQALDEYVDFVSDPLPDFIADEYNLPPLAQALRQVHFPADQDELKAGLRRLAFDELLYIQLGVLQRRRELQTATSLALVSDDALLARFREGLPFALTNAQVRVLDEVNRDLARTLPMTRLVQGDVGSGKTAIAAAAMYVAAANGAQSALLAPTQILAEQHHRSLSKLLGSLTRPDGRPLEVALLTGRVTGGQREAILAALSAGEIDILVGTTALIQDAVEFANLGLVVVDEQHRFGVEQRGALRNRGDVQPHLLVMSATPIPRSLALTIYGDLDLSVIDEMPPGREPIKTKWFSPRERERIYGFMRHEAQAGRQAFVVYPLVEESEKLNAGAAVSEHERLQAEVFPDLRLALLHGRMTGQEKDEVMRAFAEGEYDILVSTTVIEVGIDVPNASVILIEDAERFGLAQLHQLRGRIGRGEHKSYCALVSKAEGDEAAERLRALEATQSGFDLAEKDLELRGPGDFLGTRQSGLPDLRVALLSDMDTLLTARTAAQTLFAQDPTLISYPQLARQVEQFWHGHGDVS